MSTASYTLRHAVRRLVRAPGFALAATLTLMLGIGGASAVFTLVNGVLLRPLPYDHPEQLVDLGHTLVISGIAHIDQSDATYLLYRRDNHVFSDVGAYRATAVNVGDVSGATSSGVATPQRVSATLVTASVFDVLRAAPEQGRGLREEDTRPGAPAVVVIGRRLWEHRFGADPAAIGRRVVVNGVSREIIGVMPARFQFPTAESELWLPLVLDPAHIKSAAFDYLAIARLRDGVSPATATSDLQRILPRVPEVFPGRLTAAGIAQIHMQPTVRPQRDVVVGDVSRELWIVLGAVGALLLIACANVANLFLARAEGRQHELVVRRALGAGRGALLAEFVAEAAILATIGGALGLACAAVGVGVLESVGTATRIPRLAEVHVDGMVVAVTAALATLTAMIISAVPVARFDRASISAALIVGGRSATTGRTRHSARRALVVTQVALALILLVTAGLFARSFTRLRALDPGFTADHAVAWRLSLPALTYPTTRDAAGVIVRTLDAVGALPGVQSVGVATKLPLDAESRQDSAVFIEDHPLQAGSMPNIHEITFVTPGYFGAMRIPVIDGRLFARPDVSGEPAPGPAEVVVSQAFAMRYWTRGQAIGKRIRMNPTDQWSTIVGVVGSVRDVALDQPPAQVVYSPLVTLNFARKPWAPHDVAFVARTSGDPTTLVPAVRRVVETFDPTLPLYRVMPVSTLVSEATARVTFTLFLLGVAAVVATTLGALGIYGVISYLVSLRAREIGVRLALGAQRADVRRLIARQAVVDGLIGVGIGLVGAVLVTRAFRAVLFEIRPTDPPTLTAASVLLLGTAYAASWIPARRAAALDPASSLRAE